MKIPARAARLFSHALLRVHTATTEGQIAQILERARQDLAKGGGSTRRPTGAAGSAWLIERLTEEAERCREALHRAAPTDRGQPPGGGRSSLRVLTRREREVLHRIALGETDAAIGRALGIAPKTASKHVENILRKLGVETRTAAASTVFH